MTFAIHIPMWLITLVGAPSAHSCSCALLHGWLESLCPSLAVDANAPFCNQQRLRTVTWVRPVNFDEWLPFGVT